MTLPMFHALKVFRSLPNDIPMYERAKMAMAARRMYQLRGCSCRSYQMTSQTIIAVLAQSAWARNLATQEAIQLGFTPGTDEFNKVVNTGANNLAARFLKGVDIEALVTGKPEVPAPVEQPTPTPQTETTTRRRGRPPASGATSESIRGRKAQ